VEIDLPNFAGGKRLGALPVPTSDPQGRTVCPVRRRIAVVARSDLTWVGQADRAYFGKRNWIWIRKDQRGPLSGCTTL